MELAPILAMLHAIAPHADSTNSALDVAAEIAHVVDDADPAFGSAQQDAATLLEMAWQESRFLRTAAGDRDAAGRAHSLGVYQLGGVPAAIAFDIAKATRVAYARLRASAKGCPDAPISIYASGQCQNRAGRRISAYRMREAERIASSVRLVQSSVARSAVADRQSP